MRSRGWTTVAVLCLAPVLLWALAQPPAGRFATTAGTLKSLANIAALVGTAALAVTLVLGSRLRVVEWLFLGLDRVYRAHRTLGVVAVGLVVLHALLLALSLAVRSGPVRGRCSRPAPGGGSSSGWSRWPGCSPRSP